MLFHKECKKLQELKKWGWKKIPAQKLHKHSFLWFYDQYHCCKEFFSSLLLSINLLIKVFFKHQTFNPFSFLIIIIIIILPCICFLVISLKSFHVFCCLEFKKKLEKNEEKKNLLKFSLKKQEEIGFFAFLWKSECFGRIYLIGLGLISFLKWRLDIFKDPLEAFFFSFLAWNIKFCF